MVSLVLVAHSQRLLDALVELVGETVAGAPACHVAGGTDDGRMGTSLRRVLNACRAALARRSDGALILYDAGSAWLMIGFALDELGEEERKRLHVSHAPLVEGTLAAAARGAVGAGLREMAEAADEALRNDKQPDRIDTVGGTAA
ncbi:MAG: phosphoenolpyruvate---glycerone phosphotransferase subunit DhaM [Chloroflexota bacterium]|jgi:PTS hybrid protein|nr:phosphoenolpyruvate---glycerone phosphotransferase subunit DhaM [Chloroflexota bacterium]